MLRALNFPINLNKLRIMRATGSIPAPLTIFGLPKLSHKFSKRTQVQDGPTAYPALVMETVSEPESRLENEEMETAQGETWYLPSARRSQRRQSERERQEKLEMTAQQEQERNMAMVEEWTRSANSAYPYYGYIQNYQPVYQTASPYYSPGPATALAMYPTPQPSQALQPPTPYAHVPAPETPVYPQQTLNPGYSQSPAPLPIAAPQARPPIPPLAALQTPPTASPITPIVPVQPSPLSSHPMTPAMPSPTPSKRPLGYMYAPSPRSGVSHTRSATAASPELGPVYVVAQNSNGAAHASVHGNLVAAAAEAPVLPYKSAYSYAYDLLTPPSSILEHSPKVSARSTGGL